MKRLISLSIIPLSLLISSSVLAESQLIKNIKGYTFQQNKLVSFHAIQFSEDKIDKIFVGKEKLPLDKNLKVIDGNGRTMLPGLIDAHGHVLSYGKSIQQVDLNKIPSEQDAVQATVAYAKKNSALKWVQGRGWNQTQWPSNKFPTAKSLDALFPNTPVWLKRVDGHAGWANSKAMEIAGINQNTKSPTGGEIIRDINGEPTGVFIDNAMALIDQAIAPLTIEEQKIILDKTLKKLASFGLTSVHDAGITSEELVAYKALQKEDNMAIRINAMLYLPSTNWQQTLNKGRFTTSNDMLSFNSVKIQADGALGSRGAALIEDYSDKEGHRGLMLHDQDALSHYVETAMKLGFQVNTHAIGDQANHSVLNIYQDLINKHNSKALRNRIEHAQILKLSDIARFKQNNIIASMQATHATSDKNMAEDRVGFERMKGGYAWQKVIATGAIIAAGSDFPVESPNPFFGLHASVTRQDHKNQPADGWYKDQAMTREQALKSFTYNAAFSGHQEHIIGSLGAGKKADFILLKEDFFTQPAESIWQNKVLETWVNGQQVYLAKK